MLNPETIRIINVSPDALKSAYDKGYKAGRRYAGRRPTHRENVWRVAAILRDELMEKKAAEAAQAFSSRVIGERSEA